MNVSCPECSTVYRVDPAKVPQGGVRARCSTCNGVIPIGSPVDAAARSRRTPSDPIGDAFAPRPQTPSPFIPSPAHTLYSPGPRATPAAPVSPVRSPQPPPRVATPPVAQPRVAAPQPQPRVTPPSIPQMPSPASPSPGLGASLPPLRTTPRTPWQPMSAVPTASAPVLPVSVPAFTPPPPSPVPAPGERRPINPFLTRDPGLRAKRLARALVSDMVAYYPAKHSEGLEKGTLKELFRDEIKKSYDEYVAQVGADFARATTHFQESLNEVLGAGKKIF